MARLPTTATTNAALSSDSLEVVIDNGAEEADEQGGSFEMTVTQASRRAGVKKKLNGIWMKLSTLSPADLVQELKVRS